MSHASRAAGVLAWSAALLFAGTALAASGGSVQLTDITGRLPAVVTSGGFIVGFLAGAVLVHFAHLLFRSAQRALFMTFMLSGRTVQSCVVLALLAGLIFFV